MRLHCQSLVQRRWVESIVHAVVQHVDNIDSGVRESAVIVAAGAAGVAARAGAEARGAASRGGAAVRNFRRRNRDSGDRVVAGTRRSLGRHVDGEGGGRLVDPLGSHGDGSLWFRLSGGDIYYIKQWGYGERKRRSSGKAGDGRRDAWSLTNREPGRASTEPVDSEDRRTSGRTVSLGTSQQREDRQEMMFPKRKGAGIYPRGKYRSLGRGGFGLLGEGSAPVRQVCLRMKRYPGVRVIEKEEGEERRTEEKEDPFIGVAGGSSVRPPRRSACSSRVGGARTRAMEASRRLELHPPTPLYPQSQTPARPFAPYPVSQFAPSSIRPRSGPEEHERTGPAICIIFAIPPLGPRPAFPCSCERAPRPSTIVSVCEALGRPPRRTHPGLFCAWSAPVPVCPSSSSLPGAFPSRGVPSQRGLDAWGGGGERGEGGLGLMAGDGPLDERESCAVTEV